MDQVKKIIRQLSLEPHIEGGYYKRNYQSSLEINLDNKVRPLKTAIYYLLESGDFSCWHRLKSDELWHYYCGSELILHQIDQYGVLSSRVLGNVMDNTLGHPQYVIAAGTWFAAEVKESNSFSLVGCSLSPGFDFEDFELGVKENLLQTYPQHEKIIERFIRKK